MDFRRYVRDHLPPLAIAREPEIVDELAQHLSDLYDEARAEGADARRRGRAGVRCAAGRRHRAGARHRVREPRAARPDCRPLARRERRATATQGDRSMLTDLRRDLRYAVRTLAAAPAFTLVVI